MTGRDDLQPGPYGDLRSTAKRRGPRPLAGALERLRAGSSPPTLLAAVQQAWPEAAGEQIAAQCEPSSEHDGLVNMACNSAVWTSELGMMSADLLERLNSLLPEGSQVGELRFVTRAK